MNFCYTNLTERDAILYFVYQGLSGDKIIVTYYLCLYLGISEQSYNTDKDANPFLDLNRLILNIFVLIFIYNLPIFSKSRYLSLIFSARKLFKYF